MVEDISQCAQNTCAVMKFQFDAPMIDEFEGEEFANSGVHAFKFGGGVDFLGDGFETDVVS